MSDICCIWHTGLRCTANAHTLQREPLTGTAAATQLNAWNDKTIDVLEKTHSQTEDDWHFHECNMPGSFAGAQTDKCECKSDSKPSEGLSKTRKHWGKLREKDMWRAVAMDWLYRRAAEVSQWIERLFVVCVHFKNWWQVMDGQDVWNIVK